MDSTVRARWVTTWCVMVILSAFVAGVATLTHQDVGMVFTFAIVAGLCGFLAGDALHREVR